MLLSVVVYLLPISGSSLPDYLGRATHSLFIEWVRSVDPALAGWLHDDPSQPDSAKGGDSTPNNHPSTAIRPFTVSDLRGRHPRLLPDEHHPLWIRFTIFEPRLSQLIIEKVLPALTTSPSTENVDGSVITLAGQQFQILGATLDPLRHPWADQSSYERLAQEILLNPQPPPPTLEIEFSSPTTFHVQGKKHQPFPLPELLLGNWLAKWNAFAPLAFPLEVRPFAAESLAISRYRLETHVVHFGPATYIGFTGRCTFRLLERDPYWARLVHTLSVFAFYCGSGAKTSMGLGQSRKL